MRRTRKPSGSTLDSCGGIKATQTLGWIPNPPLSWSGSRKNSSAATAPPQTAIWPGVQAGPVPIFHPQGTSRSRKASGKEILQILRSLLLWWMGRAVAVGVASRTILGTQDQEEERRIRLSTWRLQARGSGSRRSTPSLVIPHSSFRMALGSSVLLHRHGTKVLFCSLPPMNQWRKLGAWTDAKCWGVSAAT